MPSLRTEYEDFISSLYSELLNALIDKYDKKALYLEIYTHILQVNPSNKQFVLMTRYFFDDIAFSTLKLDDPFVLEWGAYLLNGLNNNEASQYLHHAAQIRKELILDHQLSNFIEACIAEKDLALAYCLIERLFYLDKNRALDYLLKNDFAAFLSPGSEISQYYARARVKSASQSWSCLGLIDHSQTYAIAANLDPSIEYKEGAPYFFERYIYNNDWDKAFELLRKRRSLKLSDKELKETQLIKLANYYKEMGNSTYWTETLNLQQTLF